jgi:hypothetical protein
LPVEAGSSHARTKANPLMEAPMRSLTIRAAGLIVIALACGVSRVQAGTPLSESEVRAIVTSQYRHVRAVDARIGDAIADGLRRSATFAQLVLALDRSDVIVYIETARGMPSSLAGRMLIAPGPAGQRYLRIQIAAPSRGNELISLVGHELQHALEVAESPGVRDEPSLIALYEAIGHGSRGHRYDTMAAQNAGRRVRLELIG